MISAGDCAFIVHADASVARGINHFFVFIGMTFGIWTEGLVFGGPFPAGQAQTIV
jgi:hypothetical protein